MKLKNKLYGATITATLVITQNSYAQDPPRGPEIDRLAARCNIGPYSQLGKAGQYNVLCNVMTDAEKCLAVIKRQMDEVGVLTPVDESDRARTEYCLETFRAGLIP